MKAYVETVKGKIPLSEFDVIHVETKQGTITIHLGEDAGKADSIRISAIGKGLPPIVVIPDGGINSIRVRIHHFEGGT